MSDPKMIGALGVIAVLVVITAALGYQNLPFLSAGERYRAYFSESGGLTVGAPVQVAGLRVGDVTDVELDGARVLVSFTVGHGVHLGDRTEAAIKTMTLLGNRMLAVSPRGDGALKEPIPLERTKSPYELPQAFDDLTKTVGGLDTNRLNDALTTLSQTFKDTPADLKLALAGITRFSRSLNARDDQLRHLLADANTVTGVLRERSDSIVGLVGHGNELLAQLRTESSALRDLSGNIASLAQQISGLVNDNKKTLRPALEKLNNVLAMVNARREDLKKAINLASKFGLSLGEAVSGGPFFKQYLVNLVPGQFMQPFIDAAFSDLGIDPNTLLPSQLTDPQVGQQATPALPTPFPRTGQGGEPRLNLPDAITGVPGDARYPYREPPAQPAPGGPPPGPPAGYDPTAPDPTAPTPTVVDVTPTSLVPPLPGPAR